MCHFALELSNIRSLYLLSKEKICDMLRLHSLSYINNFFRFRSMSSQKEIRSIRIIETIPSFRSWRQQFIKQDRQVAFVPTMGSLHEGHLNLGKEGKLLSNSFLYSTNSYCSFVRNSFLYSETSE